MSQKITITKEQLPEIQEILWDYSDWLNKHGYIDADYYCEEPLAVDAYLEDKRLKKF